MKSRYLIIADDITGSSDTGVQLKRRGIETVVTMEASSVGQKPHSYVLNTESRPLSEDEAEAVISGMLSQIPLGEFSHIVKKVDSTLRGQIAREVLATDKAFAPELLIFMPALPDLGRTTEGGIHKLNGIPVTQTEISKDPRTPITEDSLTEMLRKVYDEPVVHIEAGGALPQAGRIFCCDATSNAHMKHIVSEALRSGKKTLWVGSAAIVDNLVDVESPQLPAVALIASLSDTTRSQMHYALEHGAELVIVSPEEVLSANTATSQAAAIEILRSGRDVVIASAASYDRAQLEHSYTTAAARGVSPADMSKLVQDFMGRVMTEVMREVPISGIFSSGGDTTMGLLRQAGAHGLRIVSEVLVGIPITVLEGGPHNGMRMVTKAGAFGNTDAISFALRKIKEA